MVLYIEKVIPLFIYYFFFFPPGMKSNFVRETIGEAYIFDIQKVLSTKEESWTATTLILFLAVFDLR